MRTKNILQRDETQAPLRAVRRMPGWQIVQRYRREGWTQWLIAQEARPPVSQATVAKAIYRRGTGPAVERVWVVLERILR